MFLKKIEITGFKSFAKRTTLDFSEGGVFRNNEMIGITAIVGPNGSGKSNVADALRWAMGEQSMKHLRGKKAQDIIFAGSGKKSQLGSAQVALFLDNSDKKIPIEYPEVVITRRIFRSGESEYLINGTKVRLIDVIDLLAKAGVGQRSYCIINQGMADQILNSTLLERRSIIEEAAGVKEFQVKKERSERKLKNTKINLERVKGLLVEIEPHLRLLKRQSLKAQKGEQYRTALKQKQKQLFGYLWKNFADNREQAQLVVQELGRQTMLLQREIDELREKIQKDSKQTNQIGDQVSQLEKKQRDLNYELNNLERSVVVEEGKLELEKQRAKNVQTVEVIPVGAEFVKTRLSQIKQQQDELIARITKIEKIDQVQELKEYARAIAQEIYELYEGIAKGKIEKKKPEVELERLRTVNLKKVQEIMDNLKRARGKRDLLEKEVVEIRKKIEELVKKDRQERKTTIEMEDALRRKQFELDKIKDRFNDSKIELARVEVKEEDLVSRIRQELKIPPDQLETVEEKIDVSEHEREIIRLKVQLEQIGGIDDTILEEYEETQKRYDFLHKESADLQEAMKRLKEVVREMDKKVKEKFEDTFRSINQEFDNYFRIIFNGGKAELKKVEIKTRTQDPVQLAQDSQEGDDASEKELIIDDVAQISEEELQHGVEIVACPPGKKISNLGMLSGGERSLTSLALLFAIISHNPPPFAILDEVEAALDEANSKRFGRILRELSGKTQFILITHNRQTMREAAILYGVTMGDDGISKLLSIKLDQVGSKGEILVQS